MLKYSGPSEILQSEVPEESTIQQYINQHTNLNATLESLKSFKGKSLYRLELPVKVEELVQAYQKLVAVTGLGSWKTKDRDINAYRSISITHNPDHRDGVNPYFSTLGTDRSSQVYAFSHEEHQDVKFKNTYYDAYSFRKVHPTVRKEFDFFLSKCRLSLIRSRLSVIDHKEPMITHEKFGWHIDEPVFHNLRINIPLITEPNYLLEIKSDDYHVNEHLETGYGYSWNTLLPHRAYAQGQPTRDRAHLILGFSPWFTYNSERDAWIPNEYWGMHPFELIENNLIFSS